LQVSEQLRERINLLHISNGEKGHWIVLHRVIELRAAVVHVRWAVRPAHAVCRTRGKFHVFLIILPGNSRGIQLTCEMHRLLETSVAACGAWVGVGMHAEICS